MVWTWKILCRYHTSWMETYFLLVVSEKLCSMMSTLMGVCLLGVLSRADRTVQASFDSFDFLQHPQLLK